MYNKSESLERYFKSIKDLNPLEKNQELELAKEAKAGNARSFNKLIEHNLKIVVTIANKNAGRGIQVDDLIQQGNLGLYEAAKRFNPENGVRFTSYAGTWILKYMNKLIDSCGRIVRIPVNQEIERFEAIKRGDEVANMRPVFIDDQVSEDNDTSKSDIIFSVSPEVEENIQTDHNKKTVTGLLNTLKNRDRRVMEMFYGVNLAGGMKAKDIADEMGITQIRVYQILNTVKKDLKARV
jgi:RNA polymerase primary sigma factor